LSQNARSYVEVSRSRIAANYRAVRDAVAPVGGASAAGASAAGLICVVKANAYGHGAVEVSRVLAAEGAEWLAVSSVEEGIALRHGGLRCRILVMAGVMAWEREAIRDYRLTPVLHSVEEFAAFDVGPGGCGAGCRCVEPLDVHLKVDTGMNRLGSSASAREIAEAALRHPGLRIEGLLSHFASPTDFGSAQTPEQIRAFHEMVAALAEFGIRPPVLHLCSTNAVAYPRREAWLSLVRPGLAIYGYVSPTRGSAPTPAFSVEPALTWKAKIIAVKDVPPGARIGYGGSYVAGNPMRIAVLAAGYADGVPHRLSNQGQVIAGGRLANILGAVSMDLTTIDITHSPQLQPGDEAILLGTDGDVSINAQQIADTVGTIAYTVLCGISSRVKRFYVD
jgi:alanine racemase